VEPHCGHGRSLSHDILGHFGRLFLTSPHWFQNATAVPRNPVEQRTSGQNVYTGAILDSKLERRRSIDSILEQFHRAEVQDKNTTLSSCLGGLPEMLSLDISQASRLVSLQ